MDRAISKEEQQRERRKQWIKMGSVVLGVAVAMSGLLHLMQVGVDRDDLVLSKVDQGTIEVTVSYTHLTLPTICSV